MERRYLVRKEKMLAECEVMRCPTRRPRRRLRSSRECLKASIGLRNAFSAPRARRGWATTKFATGVAGIIIKRCRSSPPGSSREKRCGGKKYTPALTVPQVRDGLARLLATRLGPCTSAAVSRHVERRLRRNTEAEFYHWKQRNHLPPLRVKQRR